MTKVFTNFLGSNLLVRKSTSICLEPKSINGIKIKDIEVTYASLPSFSGPRYLAISGLAIKDNKTFIIRLKYCLKIEVFNLPSIFITLNKKYK